MENSRKGMVMEEVRPLREALRRILMIVGLIFLGLPLWPFYLVGRLIWGRPPVVLKARLLFLAASQALMAKPPAPGIAWGIRIALLSSLLIRFLLTPLFGVAWYLDELLYGAELRNVDVGEALFEVSAARSGSTQLAHYLEDDPRLVAPNVFQCALPFMWAWKLAPRLLKGKEEAIRASYLKRAPPAHLQRHETDPFRTDSFEVIYMAFQAGDLFAQLGPTLLLQEFDPSHLTPANQSFWMQDFLPYLDGIARKTLLFKPGRRLLIKGHFLAVAPVLETKYPRARFLTVIRDPISRIQSCINFHYIQPGEDVYPPIPWSWLVERDLPMEIAYCQEELRWYSTGGRKTVVRFRDYVKDLEGTVRKVYRECMDTEEVPLHVPRRHAPRVRTNYLYDFSLTELGVKEEELKEKLTEYRAWCG